MNDIVIHPKFPEYGIGRDGRIYSYKSNRYLNNKSKTTNGYPQIHLCINGKRTVASVHRLVAEAWIVRPSWATEVNHKNGRKQDNRVENLEWTTRAGNAKHAGENGFMPVGSNHGMAKLTEHEVIEIRAAYAGGESQVSISNRYLVGRAMIGFITRRKHWQHV